VGEICVSDVEVIPDITHSKDWFAHKVFLYFTVCCQISLGDITLHKSLFFVSKF